MKKLLLTSLLAACVAWPAMAEQKPDGAASAPASLTVGEVRKVDKHAKKITLKHGEIKNLEMPPMTMVFQVKDAALLDKAKVGDTIRFAAEKTATGALVVTDIQPGK